MNRAQGIFRRALISVTVCLALGAVSATTASANLEFEHAGVSETPEWDKARDSNPWSNRVRAFMRHDVGSPGVYRRLYPK